MGIAAPIPGSADCCPKCSSLDVAFSATLEFKGYGPGLAVCRACKAIWEALDPAQLWDPDDPLCSFSEPCTNCAFRPGSPEQANREEWKALIDNLQSMGGGFYCHKGVPLATSDEDKYGFAYPKKKTTLTIAGMDPVTVEIEDTTKLRICRGYLNMVGKMWAKQPRPKPESIKTDGVPNVPAHSDR